MASRTPDAQDSRNVYPPERFSGPAEADLDDEQRRIKDEIESTRTTGLNGPFGCWLASAAIGDRAQR